MENEFLKKILSTEFGYVLSSYFELKVYIVEGTYSNQILGEEESFAAHYVLRAAHSVLHQKDSSKTWNIAKLSPSPSSSWAELVIISAFPATRPPSHPEKSKTA